MTTTAIAPASPEELRQRAAEKRLQAKRIIVEGREEAKRVAEQHNLNCVKRAELWNRQADLFDEEANESEQLGFLMNGNGSGIASAAIPIKRKPGRPSKDTIVDSVPTAKRKPGRPPKAATTDTQIVRRKPGRPPKNATVESTPGPKSVTSDQPKRRGRPPGRKNRSAEEKAEEAKATETVKKSRNKVPLKDLCHTVLKSSKSKDGMELQHVVKGVRALGYKSRAQDFPNMVLQALYQLSSDPALATKEKNATTRKIVFKAA